MLKRGGNRVRHPWASERDGVETIENAIFIAVSVSSSCSPSCGNRRTGSARRPHLRRCRTRAVRCGPVIDIRSHVVRGQARSRLKDAAAFCFLTGHRSPRDITDGSPTKVRCDRCRRRVGRR